MGDAGKMRDVIHRMGRRCREWDYGARAIYMVTASLKERGRQALAQWPKFLSVSGEALYCASPETAKGLPRASPDTAKGLSRSSPETAKISMPLTPLGEKVLACWRRIPEFWPMVEPLECQVMPDHFHGLLFVRERLPGKALGDVIRGFKTGCREVGWADGYVDNILFREGQLRRMAGYIRDNPRRLAEKRANPALFRRVADLAVDLQGGAGAEPFRAHFSAIGNAALLEWPVIMPVQCSRRDFAYRRVRLATGGWKILRNAAGEPLTEFASPAFLEKCEDALSCARNGAVLVSPCISHGEREIARRAHIAGARVIALRNKGFAKFEKPNGALFDMCAKGDLLMLAPAAWPYVPGEKPPTRLSSLVLNRIAQLIAGAAGEEIRYAGVTFGGIDASVREALLPPT